MLNAETKRQFDSSDYLDPRWQRRRDELRGAANYTCQECGKGRCLLHAHHKYHISGHRLWEYPDSAYRVLCTECHQAWTTVIRFSRRLLQKMDLASASTVVATLSELVIFVQCIKQDKRCQLSTLRGLLNNIHEMAFSQLEFTDERTEPPPYEPDYLAEEIEVSNIGMARWSLMGAELEQEGRDALMGVRNGNKLLTESQFIRTLFHGVIEGKINPDNFPKDE